LHELDVNSGAKDMLGIQLALDELIGNMVSFVLYFGSIVAALFILGVATFAFNAVAVAILAILAVSVLFSLRDFVPNFLAGITIHSRRMVRQGDILEISGIRGKVLHVGSIDVKLVTKQSETLYVPHTLFLKEFSRVMKRS